MMGKTNVSVSYVADIDTLFVHLESAAGYYDAILGDDRVQARYDEDGRVIGFMVEGLKEAQGWLSFELTDIAVKAVS
jgi:uncharacterized protein YuzE